MASSKEQKEKFEEQFKSLIAQSEDDIRWNGIFEWLDIPGTKPFVPSQIKLDHIVEKLSPKLKDKYYSLLNKFKNGKL
jgi:hypothetical protein